MASADELTGPGRWPAALEYLRWLKSVYRRLAEDVTLDRRRQRWWARGVSIAPTAIVRLGPNSSLEIGSGSLVGPYTLLDLMPDSTAPRGTTSVLRIGKRTAINEFNNLRASNGKIVIGDGCLIAQFVSIIAANHGTSPGAAVRDQAPEGHRNEVHIGDDVWIGANAVILPGVTIGSGSVIGAGSVVTHDIPECAVAVGVPAAIKKMRQEVLK